MGLNYRRASVARLVICTHWSHAPQPIRAPHAASKMAVRVSIDELYHCYKIKNGKTGHRLVYQVVDSLG